MKRWLFTLLALMYCSVCMGATTTSLPPASTFNGTEVVPIVQNGVNKKATPIQFTAGSATTAGYATSAGDSSKLGGVDASGYQRTTTAITTGNIAYQHVSVADLAADSNRLGGQVPGYYQPAATAVTSSNIGSQHVALADSATTASTAGNGMPVGAIITFGSAVCPTGYLPADGAYQSRTTRSALFAVFGVSHGIGDGSTTFGIPDLRGEFVRGWDAGRGVDPGRSFGSVQADGLAAHSHSIPIFSVQAAAGSGLAVIGNGGAPATTGSVGGTETRPKNVSLNYCIKY